MPKSFLSDDPFTAAALDDAAALHDDARTRGRRPAPVLPFLLIPALGFVLMAVGMRAGPRAASPAGGIIAAEAPEKPEKTVRGESRAGQIVSIEAARRNVVRLRRANRYGTATPRDRARMRAWERGYRQRLALFARMYPGQTCPGQKEP